MHRDSIFAKVDFLSLRPTPGNYRLRFLVSGLILIGVLITPAWSCPECGCWEPWLISGERAYLKHFDRFPMREKTFNVGEYQVFLSTLRINRDIIDLLVYVHHRSSKKPYTKPKTISLSELNGPAGLTTVDSHLISRLRYAMPRSPKYRFRITLETNNGSRSGEIQLPLGGRPPSGTYLIILGGILTAVFAVVFYQRRKKIHGL